MGQGMGMGAATQAGVHEAFQSALNTALIVGVLASVAAAVVVAWLVTGRLLRPLDAVRTATTQIAAGRYEVSVPLPSEPELAALATDVNTLAHTLADTETRRTRLLGEVAHELRTPLTALDGYVEGMIDGVFAPSPEIFASLSEELRRLHRLADDLSSLSRAQEQGLDLHPVDADLADLASRAAARLAPQFQDHPAQDLALPAGRDRARRGHPRLGAHRFLHHLRRARQPLRGAGRGGHRGPAVFPTPPGSCRWSRPCTTRACRWAPCSRS